MAVGLGSMDMPVPSVAEWEWLNWKFPRAVHAGDTIYARWTLTQKRAPVGGAATAIVVWRVDVHTAGGALCAEGEVGASVMRKSAPAKARVEEPAAAAGTAPRRRRRRRAPAGDGSKSAGGTKTGQVVEAPVIVPPPTAVAGATVATAERSAAGTRRRRRRRSTGPAQARNADSPAPAPALSAGPSSSPAALPPAAGPEGANPLTRVIRRLRRT
jgi:hypothetical protein